VPNSWPTCYHVASIAWNIGNITRNIDSIAINTGNIARNIGRIAPKTARNFMFPDLYNIGVPYHVEKKQGGHSQQLCCAQ